ncbi:hypothetical protein K449DRAFT_397407 [Hypoxylon sp. EC38]|nr:hypothetical protein K449DRAFT_397407 [Hypoxylon sp. EC38]
MATSPTATNYPPNVLSIHCPRSDGMAFEESRFPAQHEVVQPSADQPWLAKLGEMLGEQLYPASGRSFVLRAFPEHYHLRVRNRDDGHRRDYYLYGYPDIEGEDRGRRGRGPKYYRSAVDFFDHLLWLIVDPSQDRRNCFCKLCRTPAETPGQAPNVAVPSQANPSTPGSYSAAPGGGNAAGPAQPNRGPGNHVAAPGNGPGAPTGATIPLLPVYLIPPQIDGSALFREGEVVWFRNLQQAFRLGIILRNLPGDPSTQTPSKSIIKPLSHSRSAIDNIERSEVDMRPFLTFSVPPVTPVLQNIIDQPMTSIQWDALEADLPFEEGARPQVLSLEASKIAACHIDHSFSLFNPSSMPCSFNQLSFGGVFFGCEKISVLEPVRVRVLDHEYPKKDDTEHTFVMHVKNILLERVDDGKERLLFQGDIWLLQESTLPQNATNSNRLPGNAMHREKDFRDEVAKVRGVHFEWVLVLMNVTKPEEHIRGRFYESQKLGPILYQSEWEPQLQQGIIPSIEMRLNNRLDSLGSYIGRKRSRLDTIAGAVPPETVLSLGPRVNEWSG